MSTDVISDATDPDSSAASATEPTAEAATVAGETPVVEELLVEEVSIDGMCGVY